MDDKKKWSKKMDDKKNDPKKWTIKKKWSEKMDYGTTKILLIPPTLYSSIPLFLNNKLFCNNNNKNKTETYNF